MSNDIAWTEADKLRLKHSMKQQLEEQHEKFDSRDKLKEEAGVDPETYEYEGKIFDKDTGSGIIDNETGGPSYGKEHVTTFLWKHPDGTTKRIPLPQRWHPSGVIKRIVDHNKRAMYTGITMIGMSGSGKTTLTNKIIHKIHMMGEKYVVKRWNGRDMLDLDKHLGELEVGKPHIMVFDDASYTMEDAGKSDIARLANALTTIRHIVKARVIIIINFHYTRATKKFFRNQHFTFLTSVSVEEMSNLSDMYKDKMPVVRVFAKQYNRMMLRGYFDVATSSFNRQIIRYETNKPFRLALVAEIADLHFMVYDRDECNECIPQKKGDLETIPKTIEEVAIHLKTLYKYKNASYLLRLFATIHDGKSSMNKAENQIWSHLSMLDQALPVEMVWNDVYKKFEEIWEPDKPFKLKNKKDKAIKSKYNKMSVLAASRQIAKELEDLEDTELALTENAAGVSNVHKVVALKPLSDNQTKIINEVQFKIDKGDKREDIDNAKLMVYDDLRNKGYVAKQLISNIHRHLKEDWKYRHIHEEVMREMKKQQDEEQPNTIEEQFKREKGEAAEADKITAFDDPEQTKRKIVNQNDVEVQEYDSYYTKDDSAHGKIGEDGQ